MELKVTKKVILVDAASIFGRQDVDLESMLRNATKDALDHLCRDFSLPYLSDRDIAEVFETNMFFNSSIREDEILGFFQVPEDEAIAFMREGIAIYAQKLQERIEDQSEDLSSTFPALLADELRSIQSQAEQSRTHDILICFLHSEGFISTNIGFSQRVLEAMYSVEDDTLLPHAWHMHLSQAQHEDGFVTLYPGDSKYKYRKADIIMLTQDDDLGESFAKIGIQTHKSDLSAPDPEQVDDDDELDEDEHLFQIAVKAADTIKEFLYGPSKKPPEPESLPTVFGDIVDPKDEEPVHRDDGIVIVPKWHTGFPDYTNEN